MYEAFNQTPVTKTLLGEVHKLLTLYMSLPVASATSERTYFCPPLTQELPKTAPTMKQDCLNKYVLMQCHKSIVKRFACARELRKGPFGKFEYGYALGLVYDETPPPPSHHVSKRSAASELALYHFLS